MPILKLFWRRVGKLFETVTLPSKTRNGKADHYIHRWPDVTPQIAFSSKGKFPNRNKINSSIKLTKFHSKYVCFASWKAHKERKICLKIRLFGFSQRLVMGSRTTAARKVVSSSTLIGPFKIWARAQIQWPLAFALKFKLHVWIFHSTSLLKFLFHHALSMDTECL